MFRILFRMLPRSLRLALLTAVLLPLLPTLSALSAHPTCSTSPTCGTHPATPEASLTDGWPSGSGAQGPLSSRTGWPELPATAPVSTAAATDADGLLYAVHRCDSLPGGRNYTVCYDVVRRCGRWAAFPLHDCYRGAVRRSDRWRLDPDLPATVQPSLTSGSYRPARGYARGHLAASNDRTATRTSNAQTFYVTNVAPQWQNSFNGGVWSSLEADCWRNVCADTLYVVSGVSFAADTAAVADRSGQPCGVPTHFYRVLLRSKSGRTGRPAAELRADELQCVGFWFENRAYPQGRPSQHMVSVAEVERRTGMTFFVNVPQAPKQTFDPAAWHFR